MFGSDKLFKNAVYRDIYVSGLKMFAKLTTCIIAAKASESFVWYYIFRKRGHYFETFSLFRWSSIELLPSFNSEMNRSQKIKGNTSENNNNLTYHFAQLKDLAPNQRYAVFIRLVFLTRQERKGFYSETICFETDVASNVL